MVAKKPVNIRIQKISIKNYKGIDELDLLFPEPIMEDDPDIFAIGSRNGVGKTSVLECCSLLILALQENEKEGHINFRYSSIDIPDLLIRAGAKQAEIIGDVEVNNKLIRVSIKIKKDAPSTFNADKKSGIERKNTSKKLILRDRGVTFKTFSDYICGLDLNPLLFGKILFFHCHRKVYEGNINPDLIAEPKDGEGKRTNFRRYKDETSKFKLTMLRSFMALSEYYEAEIDNNRVNEIIEIIDKLLKEYSTARIGNFRMSIFDDVPSIYLKVRDKKTGELFSIDGLSSGQKEIISTIFLIWYHSENNPCVVFIDEPELHLNPEWHRKLIRSIFKIAPKNQYIIATHSKNILAAVDDDKRFQLKQND